MKYTIAVPASIFDDRKQNPKDFQELIDMVTAKALSMGATYMNFKVIGGRALFESDNERFAREHHVMMKEMLDEIIQALQTSCTFTVTKN